MRIVIATGTGRYADPWHPYQATSARLLEILEEAGFEVEIDTDVDGAMTRLDGIDLLVVNAGDPWRGEGDPPSTAALAGFAAALDRGIGVMGFHAAAATMRDYPDWAEVFGAIWIPELSWHPPGGATTISISPSEIGAGLADFEIVDERYSGLQRVGRSDVVASHEVDGVRYPTAWTRTVGRSRVAADVLGHDERSYDSTGHRELIVRLARWVGASS